MPDTVLPTCRAVSQCAGAAPPSAQLPATGRRHLCCRSIGEKSTLKHSGLTPRPRSGSNSTTQGIMERAFVRSGRQHLQPFQATTKCGVKLNKQNKAKSSKTEPNQPIMKYKMIRDMSPEPRHAAARRFTPGTPRDAPWHPAK